MKRLSPNYRVDAVIPISEELKNYLDTNYFFNLKNVEQKNSKLLIVFSGGNAMGKSHLSQAISEKFGALVIENDGIKRALLQFNAKFSRTELNLLTWQYTLNLYSRLDTLTTNGLIVRDGLIDWYYDRILPIFERAGYPVYVIGYDISESKARELILRRGDTPTTTQQRLLSLLVDHSIHNKRFRNKYSVDILLNDNNLFDHDSVVSILRQRLHDQP